MAFDADQLMTWVSALVWPFVRISAMLLVAPVFGTKTVSTRLRLGLALLLAVVVAPQLPEVPGLDPLSMTGLVVALHQVLIGVTMGFLLQMVFSAATQAGESLSLSMGLSFATAVDPVAGVQVPVVAQFFTILATLLFLAFNGHLVLIELLVISFETLPIRADGLGPDDLWSVISFGTTMFNGAMLIALPAVAALMLVNLSMGVVARAAPQLNIFAVGFPVMKLVGFTLMILMLPGFVARFEELLLAVFLLIRRLAGI